MSWIQLFNVATGPGSVPKAPISELSSSLGPCQGTLFGRYFVDGLTVFVAGAAYCFSEL